MFISAKTRKFSTRHLYINVCEKCFNSRLFPNHLAADLFSRAFSEDVECKGFEVEF